MSKNSIIRWSLLGLNIGIKIYTSIKIIASLLIYDTFQDCPLIVDARDRPVEAPCHRIE
ncbi:hypothetical protein [Nostoc sp.]|uniref:hypothetical protein n=1 Tax=Nostoc sp. TaxID=1180 RepID=UPI002FFC9AC8